MIKHGVIAINKPSGWTSFDVVNKIKHILKGQKVGHLGTLDPMATGVLLVTVGKATKLFDIMQNKSKTYVAEFDFGYTTDTLDATGKIIDKNDVVPSLGQITQAINKNIGIIMQVPPHYSAKKINGKRAYDMARSGEEFVLKSKQVEINSIDILDYNPPKLKVKIVCGSGTYIRAIGRDIANDAGAISCMTSLVRVQVGRIKLNDCIDILSLDASNISNYIKPINDVLDYQTLQLGKQDVFRLINGQIIKYNYNDGQYLINDENNIVALAICKNNKLKMQIFLS